MSYIFFKGHNSKIIPSWLFYYISTIICPEVIYVYWICITWVLYDGLL